MIIHNIEAGARYMYWYSKDYIECENRDFFQLSDRAQGVDCTETRQRTFEARISLKDGYVEYSTDWI